MTVQQGGTASLSLPQVQNLRVPISQVLSDQEWVSFKTVDKKRLSN